MCCENIVYSVKNFSVTPRLHSSHSCVEERGGSGGGTARFGISGYALTTSWGIEESIPMCSKRRTPAAPPVLTTDALCRQMCAYQHVVSK